MALSGWDPDPWLAAFRMAAPALEIVTTLDDPGDPNIRYAIVWNQPAGLLSGLPGLKAIFSLGAGVDHVVADPTLPDLPIVRIVSPDLTMRMGEYVAWRVLDHFRQGNTYRDQQAARRWQELPQPSASSVRVGIAGLGVLGTHSARILATLGFKVSGWSRTAKSVEGIKCHSGKSGLASFLAESDIVVVLLPLTRETRGMLNRDFFEGMKRETPIGGPVLINAGRGGLQNEADILEALGKGGLMAASLDVFQAEPLPPDSPLWNHPRVTITPHAAASSDPDSLAPEIVRQIDNFEKDRMLSGIVDRKSGY
jgi:glyoxylate/hydroxypyruvate reductase A